MFGLDEKAIGPGGGSYVAPREYWWGVAACWRSSRAAAKNPCSVRLRR